MFLFRITNGKKGEEAGPHPRDIDARDTARLLSSLSKAVDAMAEWRRKPSRFALVDVVDRSDGLVFEADDNGQEMVEELAVGLQGESYYELPYRAQQGMYDVSDWVHANGFGYEFRTGKRLTKRLVTFAPGAALLPPPRRMAIDGPTSVVGMPMRVGGVRRPTVEIRLVRQSTLVHAVVGTKLAKLLAKHLYERVVFYGQATWDAQTLDIVAFDVHRIEPVGKPNVVEAFENLAEAAGETWADVDASEFVRAQRGDR